jgi:hypothetical protein
MRIVKPTNHLIRLPLYSLPLTPGMRRASLKS